MNRLPRLALHAQSARVELMTKVWHQWQDRALIALLLTACLVLAFLQYRWTGDLSRAETHRLLASAQGRLQQFAQAFDSELRRSVADAVPSGEDTTRLGPERANQERLTTASQRWERPLFRKIAAAVPGKPGELHLLEASPKDHHFVHAEWPVAPEWHQLRTRLQGLVQGESPHGFIVSPASALIEVPVFGADRELEWMIFELDVKYAVSTWLPELIRIYLNPEGEENFDVSIAWGTDTSNLLLGKPEARMGALADAEGAMFPLRFARGRDQARGRESGKGREFARGRESQGRWRVAVTHRAGSIDAAVAATRKRNLAAAFMLLALIAAASAALLHNTRQSKRLASAQFQFFAGVSHELRTPLTVIQGAGHNLLTGVVKDEAQRENYARAIVKQAAQLKEMVDQLLAYGASRATTGDSRSAMLDLAVSEAIESAALELEQSQRSVDVDMPADLPPVRGDQVTLRRVLGNLILNAVRHGGGQVTVAAVKSGDMVEIRVADTGEGIPPEDLKQVFDPFFRGQSARNGRTRGTGLGLSLVKETVEGLGGVVAVDSTLGKGTVFTVRLPVAA